MVGEEHSHHVQAVICEYPLRDKEAPDSSFRESARGYAHGAENPGMGIGSSSKGKTGTEVYPQRVEDPEVNSREKAHLRVDDKTAGHSQEGAALLYARGSEKDRR